MSTSRTLSSFAAAQGNGRTYTPRELGRLARVAARDDARLSGLSGPVSRVRWQLHVPDPRAARPVAFLTVSYDMPCPGGTATRYITAPVRLNREAR